MLALQLQVSQELLCVLVQCTQTSHVCMLPALSTAAPAVCVCMCLRRAVPLCARLPSCLVHLRGWRRCLLLGTCRASPTCCGAWQKGAALPPAHCAAASAAPACSARACSSAANSQWVLAAASHLKSCCKARACERCHGSTGHSRSTLSRLQ